MDEQQLRRLMSESREDSHVEFKEAKDSFSFDKICKYAAAFANEGGGSLILGVSDEPPRRIVGTGAYLGDSLLASRLVDKLRVAITVSETVTAEGRVVIITSPSRPTGTAISVDGAYWMRAGESLVAMTPDRLKEIFAEDAQEWLSADALAGCSEADVVRLLDTQGYFDLIGLPYPTNRDGVIARLERERLIRRDGNNYSVSRIGALLIAKSLADFGPTIARKAPRVIVYEAKGKLATRLDRTGNKGLAVGFEGLVDFIITQTPTNEVIKDALRTEVKMFPGDAIRELVANALVHQDFSQSGSSVTIEVYPDRLEITNPGQPFIPTDRFIDDYRSRNEHLAELMRRLGICEEKGSGIDRVVYGAEAYQLPAPDFRVSDTRTLAILFGHKDFESMDKADRIRACYQHCCLRYVMNERMSNQSLRERFKLPEGKAETASRIIRDAIDIGKIKPEDPANLSKRYAKYIPFWA